MTWEDQTFFFNKSATPSENEEDTRYENQLPNPETDRESDAEQNQEPETEIDPEQTSQTTDANHLLNNDIEFIFSNLTQRYNYEIGRKNNLRSLAIFSLTALGFLITVGVSVLGINWMNYNPLPQFPHWLYLFFIPIPICFILAIWILFMVEGNRWHVRSRVWKDTYFWEYPDDNFVKECASGILPIIDQRYQCEYLASVVMHNTINNNFTRKIGNWALGLLIISIVCGIIFCIHLI